MSGTKKIVTPSPKSANTAQQPNVADRPYMRAVGAKAEAPMMAPSLPRKKKRKQHWNVSALVFLQDLIKALHGVLLSTWFARCCCHAVEARAHLWMDIHRIC